MKAKVLSDACIGCGACASVAPSVFELGDEGFATVVGEVTDENKEDVIDASEGCPTGAISIEE